MTYQPAMFTARGRVKHAADRSDLERKLDAADARLAAYKRQQRAEAAEIVETLMATAPADWTAFVHRVKSLEVGNGGVFCRWLETQQWLLAQPRPVRILALKVIERRCDRIRRDLGLETLDDPVLGDSVFFRARRLLA